MGKINDVTIRGTIMLMNQLERQDAKKAALELIAYESGISFADSGIRCAVSFQEDGDLYVGQGTQCQDLLSARDHLIPTIKTHWKLVDDFEAKAKEVQRDETRPTPEAASKCTVGKHHFYTIEACTKANKILISELVPALYANARKVLAIQGKLEAQTPLNLLRVRPQEVEHYILFKFSIDLCIKLTELKAKEFEKAAKYLLKKQGISDEKRLDFMTYAEAISPVLADFIEIEKIFQSDMREDRAGTEARFQRASIEVMHKDNFDSLPIALQFHRIYKRYEKLSSNDRKPKP